MGQWGSYLLPETATQCMGAATRRWSRSTLQKLHFYYAFGIVPLLGRDAFHWETAAKAHSSKWERKEYYARLRNGAGASGQNFVKLALRASAAKDAQRTGELNGARKASRTAYDPVVDAMGHQNGA